MKCKHFDQEHPDNTKFCPETGKEMEQKPATQAPVCQNPDCDFREPLPLGSCFCPNCGKSLNIDQHRTHNTSVAKAKFPLYDIVLGETTIEEVADRADLWESIDEKNGSCSIELGDSITAYSPSFDSPINAIIADSVADNLNLWNEIIPIDEEPNIHKIAYYCKKKSYPYRLCDSRYTICIIVPQKGWLLTISDDGSIAMCVIFPCLDCGSKQWHIEDVTYYGYELTCKTCNLKIGKKWTYYTKPNAIWDDCEEIICPECGSNDCKDDGSGYLQYVCNDCGHVWGEENNEEEESEEGCSEADEKHTFFPVFGIMLGETALEEIEDDDSEDIDIEYCDSGVVIAWSINSDGYHGAQIRKESYEDEFSNIYITQSDEMFEEWSELGFDWNLSYKEWAQLFEDRGYEIEIIEHPHKEFFKSRNYWYFNARFRAISPDYSLFFELHFSFGENGTKESSKGTLYSIKVTDDISHLDE